MLQSRIIPFIGGGPTPATILSGLVYELDPQRVTLASGRIADWQNGIAQSDPSLRALYVSSDAGFNGQPVASFDSSLGNYRYYPVGDLTALTAGEIFTVFWLNYGLPPEFPTPWPGGTDRLTGFHQLGRSGNNIHVPYVDGNLYDDFGCTARFTVAGGGAYFSPAPQLMNARANSSQQFYEVDGTVLLNRSSGYTVGFSAAALFGASNSGGGIYGISGRVAYHCLCSQVQSAAARAAMKEYLSLRFATPGYWS